MAYSRVVATGDGSTKQFAVNFALDYLKQSDVTCRVGGELADRAITFLSTNLIQVSGTAVPAGVKVVFTRTVAKDSLLVNYHNGDQLDEDNLMTAQKQAMMAVHEVIDGRFAPLSADWDFNGFRAVNVGAPIADTDAANKGYVIAQTASSVIAAQQSAADAATSKVATELARDLTIAKQQQAAANAVDAMNSQIAAAQARDQAVAAASSVSSSVIPTKAAAQLLNPTVSPEAVILAGLLAAGDGGGGLFKKVATQPTHTAKFQMANGTWYEFAENVLNVKAFGAVADFNSATGLGTDSSAAIQSALDLHMTTGKPVYVPAGTYKANNLTYVLAAGANGQREGCRIFGDGSERTKIYGTTGVTLKIEGGTGKYLIGCFVKGMTFSSFGRGAGYALILHRCVHTTVHDVYIVGHSQDGIYVPTLYGDADPQNDGAVHIVLDQVRINYCDNYGINCAVGTGVNENSFFTMRNVTVEQCGNATTTAGGGMYWRGQMLLMQHVGFVICNNRGLYIEGGAGLGQNIAGYNVTFENNLGKHLECWGISQMMFEGLQIYCSPAWQSSYGIYLNGTTSTIQNVHIRSCRVRCDQTAPFIAFHTQGANVVQCVVENVVFPVWNALANQYKYSGDWIVRPQIRPNVSARATAAQTVVTSDTGILFNTKDHDPANAYNAVSGQYTAPVTGQYLVSAGIALTAPAAGVTGFIKLFSTDTGTELARKSYKFVGGADESMDITRLVTLTEGQHVAVRAVCSANLPLLLGGNNQNNYLSIVLHQQG
ncbi:hypothetical protein UP09_03275 [Bradyrhizobium sp. LTSP885]|uniref:phage tail fiber domain-containing protein n=1 Tax=Bradyrhizobium sp. LTSP885 TaxID=1619232 RepID=UPI0005CB65D4|nr:phage tail fiber protein [Bradyrhizobium sp. LTSP885]KJC51081.1 hypothetical protein UP09_03275 [Bradyrhizobium sp. LTSP885]